MQYTCYVNTQFLIEFAPMFYSLFYLRGDFAAGGGLTTGGPIITVTPGTRTQTPTPGGARVALPDPPESGAAAAVTDLTGGGGGLTSDDEDFDQERLLDMLRKRSRVLPAQIDVELGGQQKVPMSYRHD